MKDCYSSTSLQNVPLALPELEGVRVPEDWFLDGRSGILPETFGVMFVLRSVGRPSCNGGSVVVNYV